MSTQLAFDLRLARRRDGYTQADIAAMLSIHQSVVSDLEGGTLRPDLEQIITLSLIYGRSFEDFFAEVMADCTKRLKTRLSRLPQDVRDTAHTFNRATALKRLKERLAEPQSNHGRA